MILPIREVRAEIPAHFPRQVLTGVGIETLPFAQRLVADEPDGKELASLFFDFNFSNSIILRCSSFAKTYIIACNLACALCEI
jgi:hypothetical protein